MEKHPKFVSIDWDFFPWHGLYAAQERSYMVNEKELPSWWVFDWGHDDRFPPSTTKILWESRKGEWERWGLDIESEFNIHPDRGCTDPADFIKTLNEHFNISEAELHHFDDHGYALLPMNKLFNESGFAPVEVIHFDAHSDLGYYPSDIRKRKRRKKRYYLDSGVWLFEALYREIACEATIVYPDWKSYGDLMKIMDFRHVRDLIKQARLQFLTWSEWKRSVTGRHNVDMIAIARSSAWTPPWLDEAFIAFVNSLDCGSIINPYRNPLDGLYGGLYDTSVPRDPVVAASFEPTPIHVDGDSSLTLQTSSV